MWWVRWAYHATLPVGPMVAACGAATDVAQAEDAQLKHVKSKTCKEKARIMQTGQQRIRQKTKHMTEKRNKLMTDTKEKNIKDKQKKDKNSKQYQNIAEEVEFLLSNDQGLRDKFRAATSRVLTEILVFSKYIGWTSL